MLGFVLAHEHSADNHVEQAGGRSRSAASKTPGQLGSEAVVKVDEHMLQHLVVVEDVDSGPWKLRLSAHQPMFSPAYLQTRGQYHCQVVFFAGLDFNSVHLGFVRRMFQCVV